MRKVKKFSQGGRAEAARDRRMADIESDYKKAIARGVSEKEARAKRAQREADARDDYAKRTGADRTQTRAAEKAAEERLSRARRSPDKDMKPVSVLSGGDKSVAAKADMPKVDTPKAGEDKPKAGNYDSMSFSAAFRQAMKDKGRGATFTYRGTPIKLEYASDKKSPRATPPASSAGRSGAPTTTSTAPDKMTNYRAAAAREAEKRAAQRVQNLMQGPIPDPRDVVREERAKRRALFEATHRAFAKGGKIDGIAIRGKTRLKRKK